MRTTRQGVYVVAPSGKLLGSINRRDPAAVAKVLENGLRRWRALPDEERYLTADELAELRSGDRGTARFPRGRR